MFAIDGHDVVCGLRPSIVAHNKIGGAYSGEIVCNGALASVAKSQISNKNGFFAHISPHTHYFYW
jgi:hypothetical protein